MSTIVITGISGSLARLTGLELARLGHEVIGVDYRSRPKDLPRALQFVQANYNKTRIADVFRRHKPAAVLHLGRVGNLKVREQKRFDLNVLGSAKIYELCLRHEVERLVVLSTFHIYGAHPHNHIPIQEDEPLRAYQTVPQLADAIQLDTQAVSWTYQHPEVKAVVLRPANVVGAHINNTVCRYLRQPRIPYVAGFNPMWQFIHESDMLRAILLSLRGDRSGVYNVAGRDSAPVQAAIELTEALRMPVPGMLQEAFFRVAPWARQAVPTYLVDFLKYPVIVSDDRFREDFGWEPRVGVPEAIRSTVTRMPTEAVLG